MRLTIDYKLILFYGRHYDENRQNELTMPWQRKTKGSNTTAPTPVAFELYDLKKDPMEMHNVVNDPKYKDVFESLKARLKELRIQTGDTDEEYPKIKEIIEKQLM